jgi:hypothetical protein
MGQSEIDIWLTSDKLLRTSRRNFNREIGSILPTVRIILINQNPVSTKCNNYRATTQAPADHKREGDQTESNHPLHLEGIALCLLPMNLHCSSHIHLCGSDRSREEVPVQTRTHPPACFIDLQMHQTNLQTPFCLQPRSSQAD